MSNFEMHHEEVSTMTQEAVLQSHEMFYDQQVTLDENELFCIDERESDQDGYIHAGGGALNIAFNLAIMREIKEPGSVNQTTFADDARATTGLLKTVCKPGVHSAEEIEGDSTAVHDHNDEGKDVGCGYAAGRQAISASIAENGDALVALTKELRPELFQLESADDFAQQVVDAHRRMADTTSYFSSGRDALSAAREAGADTMNVRGTHNGRDGIINLVPNSSMSTNTANRASMATYDHDGWATAEIYDRLHSVMPYNPTEIAIAETIDILGTMKFLHVENFAVRRPE